MSNLNSQIASSNLTAFTNGCFDLFHAGHVEFLRQCRQLGSRLIVGLNSDDSVRRLKGPTRPICPQSERQAVLAACRYVDEVIVFEEPTPCRLIQQLQPKTIVKGPGYTKANMPEAKLIEAWGGQVIILPGPQISTTQIIARIVSLAEGQGLRGAGQTRRGVQCD